MVSRIAVVGSPVGLHARPATRFVRAAADTGVSVMVGRPGQPPVDASSVLMVMSLGIRGGEQVELTADGEGAEGALEGLAELLAQDLDDSSAKA